MKGLKSIIEIQNYKTMTEDNFNAFANDAESDIEINKCNKYIEIPNGMSLALDLDKESIEFVRLFNDAGIHKILPDLADELAKKQDKEIKEYIKQSYEKQNNIDTEIENNCNTKTKNKNVLKVSSIVLGVLIVTKIIKTIKNKGRK